MAPESPVGTPKRQNMEHDVQHKEVDDEEGGERLDNATQPARIYFRRRSPYWEGDQHAARRLHRRGLAEQTILLLPGILAAVPQLSTKIVWMQQSILADVHATSPLKTSSQYAHSTWPTPLVPEVDFVMALWLKEEAICYRSSLYFTLKRRFYPLHRHGGLFSPTVLVFRNGDEEYTLMDLNKPQQLPIVSVISVAALCRSGTRQERLLVPAAVDDSDNSRTGFQYATVEIYNDPEDRHEMKEKMRVILRIAAYNRCRRLVLGALGCGAFRNPRREVAHCWAEVLLESEFRGGWWEAIVFAVCDSQNNGSDSLNGVSNYSVFRDVLHGLIVI
ncbi:hypothetical protein KEM54_006818 [Ascosphaera aggregata]|nr:hypothetical protein KEM54_006818 [Ascosphaera aggregata]